MRTAKSARILVVSRPDHRYAGELPARTRRWRDARLLRPLRLRHVTASIDFRNAGPNLVEQRSRAVAFAPRIDVGEVESVALDGENVTNVVVIAIAFLSE